jgi:predicted RNase H-like nuclease (RuvC/YqgF family)
LVKHIDEDSTFESLLCEIDGLTEDSQEAITYTNIAFIEEVQASRKMKDTLSRSREENKELKDQLQLLQAANKKLGQENEALKAQLLPQDANQASSSTIFSFSALNSGLFRKREHQTREEGNLSNTEDAYALCKKGKPG